MLDSYFFVPASRLNKLDHILKQSPDNIIIDFEDSILSENIEVFLKDLKSISNISSYWFRLPLRINFDDELNLNYVEEFKNLGVKNIILPKIKSSIELEKVIGTYKELKFIILIEHPRLLLELENELIQNTSLSDKIYGLGLGSHDLMTFLNSKHTKLQLDYPRKKVLYLAKAYNLKAIDIASMNIFNKELFIEEIKYGEDNGYDAKFLIHPIQLEWFNEETGQDEELIKWAKNVVAHLPGNYNGESLEPFILNEEVIEKPHALKALNILKNKNYGK